MKILFLDIDGVLNHEGGPTKGFFLCIDPEHVEHLNLILDATGAEVVVSSAWRNLHQEEELQKLLAEAGMKKRFIGRTRDLAGQIPYWTTRECEIRQWLKDNQDKDVTHFVILEDQEDMGLLEKTNVIRTEFITGLGPPHVDRAIKILGKDPESVDSLVDGHGDSHCPEPLESLQGRSGIDTVSVKD